MRNFDQAGLSLNLRRQHGLKTRVTGYGLNALSSGFPPERR